VGQVQIYSRLDQEAHKALEDYRISIGLPAVAEFKRPPKIIQIGEWVDALAYQQLGKSWDLFVTGTFRPVTRRWGNPRGFAVVETSLRGGQPFTRALCSSDFVQRLASRSPSEGYVQRFFYDWVRRLTEALLTRVDFFVGFEAGGVSGANHFHALLAADEIRQQLEREAELLRQYREAGTSVQEFVRNEEDLLLWGYLYGAAGRSLVLPFDQGRGAGWYLAAAYIGKKQLGWDVSVGNRALICHRPKKGGGVDVVKSPEFSRGFYHMTLTRWHR
jgi:hypothetical protein